VPNSILSKYGLSFGSQRSKVVALAYMLDSLGVTSVTATCIIDRDYEHFLPLPKMVPLLRLTDFNSIECYLLSPTIIAKLGDLVLKGFPLPATEMLLQLEPIARHLFVLRLANEMLEWGMPWIQTERYVSCRRKQIAFDRKGFIHAYLSNGKRMRHRKVFDQKCLELSEQLSKLPLLLAIRGHDFTLLMFILISKTKRDPIFANHDGFERALAGCLDVHILDPHPLFRHLSSF
jgi:hypothetical protein